MSIQIAPSLLSADFSKLAAEVADIHRAGADLLHLDIMDGHFVPNLTFGPMVVAGFADRCPLPLDAHLMVTDADTYIDPLAALSVARIAVHVEAVDHLQRTLQRIRDAGIQAGVAINPATSLSALDEALNWTDFVLIMSVNPGFGGQGFIEESLHKIERLRGLAGDRALDISVDGGVGPENAASLVAAGATTLIAGSSVFGAPDRPRAIDELRRAAAQGSR